MSEAEEPLWLTYEQAIAIHSAQLRRFGGAPGLRDEGMLRSALSARSTNGAMSRPPRRARVRLRLRLAKNHAFVDGNKRIAFMAMMTFLRKKSRPIRPGPCAINEHHPLPRAGEVSEDSLTAGSGTIGPSE